MIYLLSPCFLCRILFQYCMPFIYKLWEAYNFNDGSKLSSFTNKYCSHEKWTCSLFANHVNTHK